MDKQTLLLSYLQNTRWEATNANFGRITGFQLAGSVVNVTLVTLFDQNATSTSFQQACLVDHLGLLHRPTAGWERLCPSSRLAKAASHRSARLPKGVLVWLAPPLSNTGRSGLLVGWLYMCGYRLCSPNVQTDSCSTSAGRAGSAIHAIHTRPALPLRMPQQQLPLHIKCQPACQGRAHALAQPHHHTGPQVPCTLQRTPSCSAEPPSSTSCFWATGH